MYNGQVVAYVRLSQDDFNKSEELSTSIYNQLGLIKAFAKSIGLKIDKEYTDDGYSGINFDRPGFEQLKNDVDTGLISIIITKDMSRLGRNFLETAYYIGEYFPSHNIRYIAINDHYDSDNPDVHEQQIMMEIKTLINDKYVKDVSIKRKQVAEAKTKEGQFIGPYAPYGYYIKRIGNKSTLEIDENTSSIVKRIFSEIASGKSRKDVADGLNTDKIPPPIIHLNMSPTKNKKLYYDWTDKTIYRIVKNKTYMGKLIKRSSYKNDYHQKKRTYISIKDRETIDNCHPIIISERLFKEANSKLKENKRKEKNEYSGLFSELVICGECGRAMTACRVKKENGNIKYHFECTKKNERKSCPNRTIADSKLQNIVKSSLKELIDTYVDDEKICEKILKKKNKDERTNLKISALKTDIELHEKRIRDLYLQKSKQEITLEEFLKQKETENQLKKKSETQLNQILEMKNTNMQKQKLQEYYEKFINNDESINEIIRSLINRITIYKDNTIEIYFKFGIGEPKKIKLF